MEWLNYHHLRYFWTVAREGGLRKAADLLHVSQPSISAQLAELERALGEPLFRRQGRSKTLTEAGQMAYRYADEIFSLGRELVNAIQQRPTSQTLRLHVGVADSFPKLVTKETLHPVLALPQPVQLVCREGKLDDLLAQLAAHRLDLVLADEPASSSTRVRTFNHPLGATSTTFCASRRLAARLRPGFPASLHEAPAFLPAENTALRRAVEAWFREVPVRPQVRAEFEDLALLKVMAAEGGGFVALPSAVAEDARRHYGLHRIGDAPECRIQFHAITAERRLVHPAVALLTERARKRLAPAATGAARSQEPARTR